MEVRILLLLGIVATAAAPAAGEIGADAATVKVECVLACTFDPPVVHVAPGVAVQWVVVSGCHTVTGGLTTETDAAEQLAEQRMRALEDALVTPPPPRPRLAGPDSALLCAAGATYTWTPTRIGEYPYYCAFSTHHLQGQHGLVVVA